MTTARPAPALALPGTQEYRAIALRLGLALEKLHARLQANQAMQPTVEPSPAIVLPALPPLVEPRRPSAPNPARGAV